MEPSSNQHLALREWLGKRFSPYCAVFSSPTVKQVLWKQSSMHPAELFRPFAHVGNLNNISLHTCERNMPFKLVNFKLNFVDAPLIDGKASQENSMIFDYIIQSNQPQPSQFVPNLPVLPFCPITF